MAGNELVTNKLLFRGVSFQQLKASYKKSLLTKYYNAQSTHFYFYNYRNDYSNFVHSFVRSKINLSEMQQFGDGHVATTGIIKTGCIQRFKTPLHRLGLVIL